MNLNINLIMKRLNIIYKKLFLDCCRTKKNLTEIYKQTGISYATILTYSKELYKQGLIVECSGKDGRHKHFKISKEGLQFLKSRNSQEL